MKILPYTIELLEPVLVTSLDGDPNSSVSFDYLPGAALRGAIIGRYIARQKVDTPSYELDAADEAVNRLFFNGQTLFLNGYLQALNAVPQQVRTLPLPRSLFREKGTKEPLYDFAGDDHPSDLEQPKPPKESFGFFEAGQLQTLEVQKSIAVHTTRNRRFGRARGGSSNEEETSNDGSSDEEQTGGVYRYEALTPGQTFLAYILCQDGDAELLASLIDGVAMIGGSRSAGYGQVRLTCLSEEGADGWYEVSYRIPPNEIDGEETAVEEAAKVPTGRIIITLLSDAVIREKSGQYSVDPTAVCRTLGLTLQKSLAFTGHRPDGSFNRKWGLPTRQVPVFSMGSVFVCETPDAAGLEALLVKQVTGFGERRAEGFGRFAVNWYHGKQVDLGKAEAPVDLDPLSLPDGSAARAAAEGLVGRLLGQQIDRYIITESAALAKPQSGLQKSQIYRLQQQILASLQDPQLDLKQDRERLDKYLEGLNKRSATRKQFARSRVGDQTIPQWITTLLDEKDLKGVEREGKIKQIGDVAPQIDKELVYRTNLRLINGVLSRMAKLAKDD